MLLGSAIMERSGLPVSRNLSTRNICWPEVDSVFAPSTLKMKNLNPRFGVLTPRCGVATGDL